MNNKGRISIGFLGILFILLIIGWLLGKTSFWHIVLFLIYAVMGFFGLITGIIGGVLLFIGLVWLVCFLIDKFN